MLAARGAGGAGRRARFVGVPAFDDLVPHPGTGRRFSLTTTAGLADAAPSGRVRLDAIARWLQDTAFGDVVDAGVGDAAIWVVRRTRIKVEVFPRFGEKVTVTTWCSGVGRMWAERRTSITGDAGAAVETVALWVHLDPSSGRPFPLTDPEMDVYLPSTAGREVKARLRHPAPPDDASRSPWHFRAAELDVADHINNAAYWTPLESELLTTGADEPAAIDVELEHKAPTQPGDHIILAAGDHRWTTTADGEVRASLLVHGLDT
jgi:acyl-ACP thioesterase